MRHVRLITVLAAAAVLAVPAAASADPGLTRGTLPSTATWASPQQVNIDVTLTCNEGVYYNVFVGLLQQQSAFMQVYGEGFASGPCTGRHQRVALSIFAFPGWQLGDAIARLSVCAFTCDSADRAIRIVF